ncbi:MAG: hypothetical protein ACRDY0_00530 [Acidimicrobiales bacterium]
MDSSDGQARGFGFTRFGAWLTGAVLALGMLSLAGAAPASAAVPASGIAAQTTCPTDPYTGVTTPCDLTTTTFPTTTTAPTTTAPNTGLGSNTGGGGGAGAGNGGALAFTGADVLFGLFAAMLLITLGTTIILAARQRRQAV